MLHRELHGLGFTGGYLQVQRYLQPLRAARQWAAVATMRFETAPGEQAQFDFGEGYAAMSDGSRRKVVLFVGRLKYSRAVHVVIVPDQKAETLVRAVVSCLEAWQCVPLIWVFDNPRTVRVSKPGERIELHPYLRGLASELNAAVMLCTPYQPQQKGSVESGVKWAKRSFLSQRRFVDGADVAAQLAVWLGEINGSRVSDATGQVPSKLLALEQERCRDRRLPFTAADYQLRVPVTVLPTGMVHVFGTSYSVDPKRLGAPAMALIGREIIEIVIGATRCRHARVDHADAPQRLPEHRQALLGAVHGERKRNSFRRQCLWELGGGARDFLDMLVHRCGADATGWYAPVNRLYTLLEEHGEAALADAMGGCHHAQRWTVHDVARALRPAHATAVEGRP